MERGRSLPTSRAKHPHRMLQADSSRSDSTLVSRSVITSSCVRTGLRPIDTGETKMISFKALAAAVLLSATAATPAFAQAPAGAGALYQKSTYSGYNPKNDFNPNGTIGRHPGAGPVHVLLSQSGRAEWRDANAYYQVSPDWPALKGACASAGGGISYCGDRYNSYDFAPDAFPRHHARRHHRQ